MTNVRIWVLLLSTVSALAGFAAGLLVYGSLHRPVVDRGPFAEYERMVVGEFELSAERQRLFRAVLESYNHEIEAVKDQAVAESMSAMEPELRRIGRKYRDVIRNRVLPRTSRDDFDRLALAHNPTSRPE